MNQDQGPGLKVKKRTYAIVWDDLFEPGMSARAWGVFCYLLSQPDGWEARAYHLQSVFKEGRDALYAVLSELVDLGLMTKETYYDGNLRRQRFLLDEDVANGNPRVQKRRSARETDSQDVETPDPETPGPEDPPQVNTDVPSTDVPTTDNTCEPADAASLEIPDADIIEITKARGSRTDRHPLIAEHEPLARRIVRDYLAWWKADRGMPAEARLVGGDNDTFMLIGIPRSANPQPKQCHHVIEALIEGYTEKQVKKALADWASGKYNRGNKPQGTVPSKGAWTSALAAVVAGRDAEGGGRAAYTNSQWDDDPTGGFGQAALGDGN
jgi:hypothetical protein